MIRFKAEAPGGFGGCEAPWQYRQAQNLFTFGIHGVSVLKLTVTTATCPRIVQAVPSTSAGL